MSTTKPRRKVKGLITGNKRPDDGLEFHTLPPAAIKPLRGMILVREASLDQLKTPSGLFIPFKIKQNNVGTIERVGNWLIDGPPPGEPFPEALKVGDRVVYRQGGNETINDHEPHARRLLMHHTNVYAIIETKKSVLPANVEAPTKDE